MKAISQSASYVDFTPSSIKLYFCITLLFILILKTNNIKQNQRPTFSRSLIVNLKYNIFKICVHINYHYWNIKSPYTWNIDLIADMSIRRQCLAISFQILYQDIYCVIYSWKAFTVRLKQRFYFKAQGFGFVVPNPSYFPAFKKSLIFHWFLLANNFMVTIFCWQ